MKKLFFSLVAAIVAATATYAQSAQVATLSVGGTTTNYYGADALKDAVNASAGKQGAVITLSPGDFRSVDFNSEHNGLTIRGAGYEATAQKDPTVIDGEFSLSASGSVEGLTFEGLYFTGSINVNNNVTKSPRFIKCIISSIYIGRQKGFENATFVHCKIGAFDGGTYNSTMTFLNCIYYDNSSTDFNNCTFHNSIIIDGSWDYYIGCTLKNCILVRGYYSFESQGIYNCVSVSSSNDNIFADVIYPTNVTVKSEDGSSVFATYRYSNDYNFHENFELTNEAKTKYLGSDGTQVGIFGGTNPFDSTPSNPQIKKFDVTTNASNGKLTVTLDVE